MKAIELRKQTKRYKEHQPCEICGKHKDITHLHHVISLKDCTMLLHVVDFIDIPVVFLCPNCHAYIHKMQKGIFYSAMLNMPHDEYQKLLNIFNMREKVMNEILSQVDE